MRRERGREKRKCPSGNDQWGGEEIGYWKERNHVGGSAAKWSLACHAEASARRNAALRRRETSNRGWRG